tara:strand:+ start:60 stop:635 length:576 start_codon:yes stop_codon:yes gene_type:complete
MKLNLFSIPIYISNIDLDKIKLKNIKVKRQWLSGTESSHDCRNEITEDTRAHILQTIIKLLNYDIHKPYELVLSSIWQNNYKNNDYQERHAHPGSHFSFIIYKKVKQSNTVFFNPFLQLMESYYRKNNPVKTILIDSSFKVECREGQIVVFPSFLEHMVLKHSNSVTISGNININDVVTELDDKIKLTKGL